MSRLAIAAVLVATGMGVGLAWSQTAAPQIQNHRYFTMPLEKGPTREVGLQSVTMPLGAGNQFHRHPGDQWTAVQEGEVIKEFAGIDLHPDRASNIGIGYVFENVIRRFNEQPNEEAGDHFALREIIRLMAHLIYTGDEDIYTDVKAFVAAGQSARATARELKSRDQSTTWKRIASGDCAADDCAAGLNR